MSVEWYFIIIIIIIIININIIIIITYHSHILISYNTILQFFQSSNKKLESTCKASQ